jgi:SAM-dependent methyltransferase
MFHKFQTKLFETRVRNESPEESSNKILNDRYLTQVYRTIFDFLTSDVLLATDKDLQVTLEIGSAGGITKFLDSTVVTSDVRSGSNIDFVLINGKLPFEDETFDRIIGKDVLHHIPDIVSHIREVERCLKAGGIAVYSEPNWNLFSRVVFTLFHPEPYLSSVDDWKFTSNDPMYSNQALPYVVFKRDLRKFQELFSSLEVEIYPPTIGLTFALSGGVYSRNKIASKLLLQLSRLEKKVPFCLKFFGLNRFIVIRKMGK